MVKNGFIQRILEEVSGSSIYRLNEDNGERFTPDVAWMLKWYDVFNRQYFNGELGVCGFDILDSSDTVTLGEFYESSDRVVLDSDTGMIYYEVSEGNYRRVDSETYDIMCKPVIALNGNYSASEESWMNTLIHEMCHYYTHKDGFVNDDNDNGHGEDFKAIAKHIQEVSNGRFTIGSIASAEEMKGIELRGDKLAGIVDGYIWLLLYMGDGSVKGVICDSDASVGRVVEHQARLNEMIISSPKKESLMMYLCERIVRCDDAGFAAEMYKRGYGKVTNGNERYSIQPADVSVIDGYKSDVIYSVGDGDDNVGINESVDEMKAKHNTNAKFDKFDTSFIGCGCGSQYYGWGIYVATDDDVAAGYRNWFADNKDYVEGTALLGSYEYEVEIPDDDGSNYIDWDGPAIKELGDAERFPSFGLQYNAIAGKYAVDGKKMVSLKLAGMGYVGIRAEGNRNRGGGGKPNYVIFNADDIKIIKRTDYEERREPIAFSNGYKGIYLDEGMRLVDWNGNVVIESPYITDISVDNEDESILAISFEKDGEESLKFYSMRAKKMMFNNTSAPVQAILRSFFNGYVSLEIAVEKGDQNYQVLYDSKNDRQICKCCDVAWVTSGFGEGEDYSSRFLFVTISDKDNYRTYQSRVFDTEKSVFLNYDFGDRFPDAWLEGYGFLTFSNMNRNNDFGLYDIEEDRFVPGCEHLYHIEWIDFRTNRFKLIWMKTMNNGSVVYDLDYKKFIIGTDVISVVYSVLDYDCILCKMMRGGLNIYSFPLKQWLLDDATAKQINDIIDEDGNTIEFQMKDGSSKTVNLGEITK